MDRGPIMSSGNVAGFEQMFACKSFAEAGDKILEPLTGHLDTESAVIFRYKRNQLGEYPVELCRHLLPRRTLDSYEQTFYSADPVARAAFGLTSFDTKTNDQRVVHLFRLVDNHNFEQSYYYNEFFKHHDLNDVLAMLISIEEMPGEVFCVALQRWRDSPLFDDTSIFRFQRLAPILSTCLGNIALREANSLLNLGDPSTVSRGMEVGVSIWDCRHRLIHSSVCALDAIGFDDGARRADWLGWFRSITESGRSAETGTIYDGYFRALRVTIDRSYVCGLPQYKVTTVTPNYLREINHWARFCSLTPREVEISKYIASGLGNESIAYQMGVSIRTVQNHIISIFAKSRVNSRSHLVARMMGWEMPRAVHPS